MEIYHSGEYVLPGIYKQVNGTRKLQLEQDDRLPASPDGELVRFERIRPGQAARESSSASAPSPSLAGKPFPR